MRVAYRVILLLGAVCLISGFFLQLKTNSLLVMIAACSWWLLGALIPVTLAAGFLRWRRRSKFWITPSLLCLALFWLSPYICVNAAVSITDWEFRRHFADYQKLVNDIRTGAIESNAMLSELNVHNLSLPGVTSIKAARCDNGAIIVECFRSGFRVSRGYVYKGDQSDATCIEENMRPETHYELRRLADDWYYFHN